MFRTTTGEWFVRRSSDGGLTQVGFGARASSGLGDLPVPADYDGDGRADFAVYRQSSGEWFIAGSTSGYTSIPFGAGSSSGLSDTPIPADYDGDGRADLAIFRQATGEWFLNSGNGSLTTLQWGAPSLGDIPVQR